jgi:AP2 domain
MSQENRRRSTNINSNNTSGITGVCWHTTNSKWVAHIVINTKQVWLGSFETCDDAVAARDAAERKYKYGQYHDTASTHFDDTADTEQ